MARIGRLVGPIWPIPVIRARCRSSVVEHSIGNGEVDSSILSGSTSYLFLENLCFQRLTGLSGLSQRGSLPFEGLYEARQKLAKDGHIFRREDAENPPLDRIDPLTRGVKRLTSDLGHMQLEHVGMSWVR